VFNYIIDNSCCVVLEHSRVKKNTSDEKWMEKELMT